MLDHLAHVAASADGFSSVLAEGDLEAPVPPCPGWRLADLANHLGEIHQWARHAVVAGNADAVTSPAPPDRAGLVAWYRASADALLATLTSVDPAQPVWGFGPRPRIAQFWLRRQAQETTLHLWDAVASQGGVLPIDPVLAADGIDELITMFFPRQVRLGRIPPLPHGLAVRTDDAHGRRRWVLAGDGTGEGLGDGVGGGDSTGDGEGTGGGMGSAAGIGSVGVPDADVRASVSGPAEAVLLLLWGRIGLADPRLVLTGDEAAAHAVLTAGLTP